MSFNGEEQQGQSLTESVTHGEAQTTVLASQRRRQPGGEEKERPRFTPRNQRHRWKVRQWVGLGVPDGVINVVTGYGATAGAAISSHMDIDMISFTGSTVTGHRIMQAAATSNLKSVCLELGGKSPFIIFKDVDLEKIVPLALLGCLYNQGQICVAGSRVFVQEEIYDEFLVKLEEQLKKWVVGDPFDSNGSILLKSRHIHHLLFF
ncbi:hypothetical protein F511_44997 [Dorcoceras hygrometricum]|uniref:Aldehyde dehydrogenase domain-containing protein n=1 Tax=Dorcoceras hygrometricum TaxID=472368 RepID=A0A2Z6ZYC8_9LAMI|nr:hypothetical protein F511_44997 [Dorcoceras hygrometricum]